MKKLGVSLVIVLSVCGCDAGSEQSIQKQVPQTAQEAEVKPNLQLCLDVLPGTTLARSSVIPMGDLRPLWRVSGRVSNNCYSEMSDIKFFIVVSKKKNSEQLDTAELILRGTIPAHSTRGIEEDIHLRIAVRDGDWQWNMYPVDGRFVPGPGKPAPWIPFPSEHPD
jgi:hypothetical protein